MGIVQLGEKKYLVSIFENPLFVWPNSRLDSFRDISVIVRAISQDFFGDFDFSDESTHVLDKDEFIRKALECNTKIHRAEYDLLPQEMRERLPFDYFNKNMYHYPPIEQKVGFYDIFDDNVYVLNEGLIDTIVCCVHENAHRVITHRTGIKFGLRNDMADEWAAEDTEFTCSWLLMTIGGNRHNRTYQDRIQKYRKHFENTIKAVKQDYDPDKRLNDIVEGTKKVIKQYEAQALLISK